MNLKVLISIALIFGLINAQATQLEVLKAWNYARQNPTQVANRIDNRIRNGLKGPKGDKSCYKEAVQSLKDQKSVSTLSEDVGLDLAAFTQADDMNKIIKNLKHIGSDKSTVKQRMKRFGTFHGVYKFYEMLAYFKQTQPVDADKIIDLMIADCGNKDRSHRRIMFDTSVNHFGAGVVYGDKQTWVTLLATKGFTRQAVENKKLDDAWIQGNGLYSGDGESVRAAHWHEDKDFVHSGEQIHTQIIVEKIDVNPGALGDFKDDGSMACPTFINSKLLTTKVLKDWHLTVEECDRKANPWANEKYIRRTLPFAKNGKCYHRLSFCTEQGRVYSINREYVTFDQWLQKYNPTSKSVLGKIADDLSVKCPQFINPTLRKKVIQDWYQNGQTCSRGEAGFDKSGFFRINPIAMKGKCYQRLQWCSEEGLVYLKDSEYKTYAEWAATNTN